MSEFDKYTPVWGRCLVLPDDIEETDEDLKRAKDAGFYLPEQAKEQEQYAQNEGTLIKVGADCFDDWSENGRIPKNGDRILFNKHAGFILKDGRHRLINDTDIMCVIGE